MKPSLSDKLHEALKLAGSHNSQVMVRPEVILWPDPDRQWESVIPRLQADLPQLLVRGDYDPSARKGPAVWLKCMVARVLPEADWPAKAIPIIYLPGVAKTELRAVEGAPFDLLPLLEYQYTGTLFLQENGKEWTVLAFLGNPTSGLGISVAKDVATRDALRKALPVIFKDREALAGRESVDAEFLSNLLMPDMFTHILKWISKGDTWLDKLPPGKREVFNTLLKTHYGIKADHRLIKDIAFKLGAQQGAWKPVWEHYAHAPGKYPEIENYLRMARPADLGVGDGALPRESWPQDNERAEEDLARLLTEIAGRDPRKALEALHALESEHGPRRIWVWAELGRSPLAMALEHLIAMAALSLKPYPFGNLPDLRDHYASEGIKVDRHMRLALAFARSDRDKGAVTAVIDLFYRPWITRITAQFQKLVADDPGIFTAMTALEENESFVLFVDAFRYELAVEFAENLKKEGYTVELTSGWSAIPSVTPTAKPQVSPVAPQVATDSAIDEFRPRLKSGKDLQTAYFREALAAAGYTHVTSPADIAGPGKYWQEIGEIDTKGHQEGAGMVRRIPELFYEVMEALEGALAKGIRRVKVVTDHGWLLLPGGLPKKPLNKGLADTRWGRCALIKEGAHSDLLHLPWRWNPMIHIAYAPDISFFKANEEYAHGGISLHECLTPTLIISNPGTEYVNARIAEVKWVNLKVTIKTLDTTDGYTADIRTRYGDPSTSIVLTAQRTVSGDSVTLMVDDAAEGQAATIVLLDPQDRIIDKKPTTVGD